MSPYFITFRSITAAQRGERLLQKNGIRCQISRTPRWMEEQGCGYCLRMRGTDALAAVHLLREQEVNYGKIYAIMDSGKIEERER